MSAPDIELECPDCGASVPYDDVQAADYRDDMAKCPECGVASPTEEWFE